MSHRSQKIQKIGPFAKGERPLALQIAFQRADGTVIDMGTFALPIVKIIERNGKTIAGLGNGTVVWADQAQGVIQYRWDDADFSEEGVFHLQMWAGDNSSQRFASDIFEYHVEERTTAPTSI